MLVLVPQIIIRKELSLDWEGQEKLLEGGCFQAESQGRGRNWLNGKRWGLEETLSTNAWPLQTAQNVLRAKRVAAEGTAKLRYPRCGRMYGSGSQGVGWVGRIDMTGHHINGGS